MSKLEFGIWNLEFVISFLGRKAKPFIPKKTAVFQ